MKKHHAFVLGFVLFTIAIISSASAKMITTPLYHFFDKNHAVCIPESFSVIYDDITDEELEKICFTREEAMKFLDDYNVDLFAFDDNERCFYIGVYENPVPKSTPYEGYEDAVKIAKVMTKYLDDPAYDILFIEPYITDTDCFGKAAFTFESDGETVYCLEYCMIYDDELIDLIAYSNSGQYSIEDEHILDEIACSIGIWITLNQIS